MYKTLIVVDQIDQALLEQVPELITFDDYLRDYPKRDEPRTRIINLCDTAVYLSRGYYCSLLAEARKHRVLPSVRTINELRHQGSGVDELVPLKSDLAGMPREVERLEVLLFLGRSQDPALQGLVDKLFRHHPAPVLALLLEREGEGLRMRVEQRSFASLSPEQQGEFIQRLVEFTRTVWRVAPPRKQPRWEMAILVDPEEKVPPSNREAINRFIRAAGKNGIHAEALSVSDMRDIAYYDALFIRQTTAIDHYTYALASRGEKQGLVVIDDPTSILRCCNKVFLHDAFNYRKVPSLRTLVVGDDSEDTLARLENEFGFPLVLKMPEGSFSRGVFKVADRAALREKLRDLLSDSALVLAQEYLYTEFDWRIGVLNGRALYACRYLMARNHWQIYNHDAKRFFSGGFDTLPTFEAPKAVLDASLKAASIIGDGLYGVDVKELEKRAYVLEVNDNPSIDHKVEDAYLGDELYMQIMAEFYRRLEARGRK